MFGSAKRERELLRQLLEQEKYVNRLRAKVAELENEHLKLLEEHLQCQKKAAEQAEGQPAIQPTKPTRPVGPPRRGNYPQDILLQSPPVTQEKLREIFGKKDGN